MRVAVVFGYEERVEPSWSRAPMMPARVVLVLSLAACTGGTVANIEPDPDPVEIACDYRYDFGTNVEEDVSSFEMTCEQYGGQTTLDQLEAACEQDGTDAGASTSECTCVPTIPDDCDSGDSGS